MGNVPQHLVAPVILEVHVDVGHLFALNVQEALEDEAVLHWVDFCDAQAIEGNAGGSAATNAQQYVVFAGKVDDVPYH